MEAVDKPQKLAKPVSGGSADGASHHANNPESALRDQLAQLGGRDQGWGSVPEDEIIRILPLFIQVQRVWLDLRHTRVFMNVLVCCNKFGVLCAAINLCVV